MKKNYEKATTKKDEVRDFKDEHLQQPKINKPDPESQDYRFFIKKGKCPNCLKNTIKKVDDKNYKCSSCKREWTFINGKPIVKW